MRLMERPVGQCEYCRTIIVPRPSGPLPRFCSAVCRVRSWRQVRGCWRPSERRECAQCGTSFLPKKRLQVACTRRCGWLYRGRRASAGRVPVQLYAKLCQGCGVTFTPKHQNQQRYCSYQCRLKIYDARGSRIGKHDRLKILSRDEWRCYLCRGPILQDCRWPEPLSGTVDHVIPWSVSHNDDPSNLKAAHWYCNKAKGDRVLGVELGMSMGAA